MSQCPSCGGDCGYTKKGGCRQMPLCLEPQKEWVGLTDEEIDELACAMVKSNKSVNWLCKAIEAKLRSKNGG